LLWYIWNIKNCFKILSTTPPNQHESFQYVLFSLTLFVNFLKTTHQKSNTLSCRVLMRWDTKRSHNPSHFDVISIHLNEPNKENMLSASHVS
jgi:hypothetical protein